MFKHFFYTFALAAILFAAILFTGCNNATTSPQTTLKGTTSSNPNDYMLKGDPGTTYHYTISVKYTDTLSNQRTEEGYMDWKILEKNVNNPHFGVCDKVLQKLYLNDSKDRVDTAYFTHNQYSLQMVVSMNTNGSMEYYQPEEKLLSTPIELNNSWVFTKDPVQKYSKILSDNEHVNVPAGGFNSIHTQAVSSSPIDGDGVEKEELNHYFSTDVVMCKFVNLTTRSYPSGAKATILYTMELSEIR